MPRIAFSTFAVMTKPYGSPEVHGFELMVEPAFRVAENSPGFIARAKETDHKTHLSNFERDWGEWGKFEVPKFYDGGRDTLTDTRASTLTIWKSIKDAYVFSYQGFHMAALRQRKKWFRIPKWPTYVIWWIDDDETPTWADSAARFNALYDNGSTPYAFDFKKPFDASGIELEATAQTLRRERDNKPK